MFISNRSYRDYPNIYIYINDLLKYLISIYKNINYVAKAKFEYDSFFIKSLLFRDFYIEFSRLSDIVDLDDDDL